MLPFFSWLAQLPASALVVVASCLLISIIIICCVPHADQRLVRVLRALERLLSPTRRRRNFSRSQASRVRSQRRTGGQQRGGKR